MSRLFSLFLSLCVTAGVLAACSSNSSEAGTAGEAKKHVETVALTFVTHDSFAIFGSWMKDFPALLPGGQSPVLTYFKHSATRAVEIPRKRREIK